MARERPVFLDEQVGKLSNIFRVMGRLALDGIDKPVTTYKKGEQQVVVDVRFVQGIERVAESIKQDLRREGREHLFYETYRKERGA